MEYPVRDIMDIEEVIERDKLSKMSDLDLQLEIEQAQGWETYYENTDSFEQDAHEKNLREENKKRLTLLLKERTIRYELRTRTTDTEGL